jgi:hypothetical protein
MRDVSSTSRMRTVETYGPAADKPQHATWNFCGPAMFSGPVQAVYCLAGTLWDVLHEG